MMIVLNRHPSSGKLTVSRLLAERIIARFFDAHTPYNLASALSDKGIEPMRIAYANCAECILAGSTAMLELGANVT